MFNYMRGFAANCYSGQRNQINRKNAQSTKRIDDLLTVEQYLNRGEGGGSSFLAAGMLTNSACHRRRWWPNSHSSLPTHRAIFWGLLVMIQVAVLYIKSVSTGYGTLSCGCLPCIGHWIGSVIYLSGTNAYESRMTVFSSVEYTIESRGFAIAG